jgi:hypothetical protein
MAEVNKFTRRQLLRAIYWRPWVGLMATVYAVLGACDFAEDHVIQHLPLPLQNIWHEFYKAPQLSGTAWLIIFLSLLVVVTLEGAYRLVRTRDAQHHDALGSVSHEIGALKQAVHDRSPQLNGFIDVVLQVSGSRAGGKHGRLLILLVNVTNTGAPSLAHRWRVYVTRLNELEIESGTVYVPQELTIRLNDKLRMIDGRESIIERVAHDPVPTGGGQRGWLFARLDEALVRGTKVTVRFRDVNGRESYAERTLSDETRLDDIGPYPGVTYRRVKSAAQPIDVTPLDQS